MSEDLAVKVGEALEKARNAQARASEAYDKGHKAAGAAQAALNELAVHGKRIETIEEEQVQQRSATERLADSVDRLTRKLPSPRSPSQITREMWNDTSRKGKVGAVAVLAVIFSPHAIEFVKQLGELVQSVAKAFGVG